MSYKDVIINDRNVFAWNWKNMDVNMKSTMSHRPGIRVEDIKYQLGDLEIPELRNGYLILSTGH